MRWRERCTHTHTQTDTEGMDRGRERGGKRGEEREMCNGGGIWRSSLWYRNVHVEID